MHNGHPKRAFPVFTAAIWTRIRTRDILQQMSELFGDLQGVLIYFDDFLVMGDTLEELEANLRRVLVRCRKVNLKLQLKKCRFFLKEIHTSFPMAH